ncbi:MAG: SHOCT domain-containing protein [Fibrobacterota bacterium]
MDAFVFLAWIGFSCLVGHLAGQRGRNGTGWGFLAAAISPLIAGIILFILHEKDEKEKKETFEKNKITSAEFLLRIHQLQSLHDKHVLDDSEYELRKNQEILWLKERILVEGPEGFLAELISALDKGLLTQDEMQKIKQIVYSSR